MKTNSSEHSFATTPEKVEETSSEKHTKPAREMSKRSACVPESKYKEHQSSEFFQPTSARLQVKVFRFRDRFSKSGCGSFFKTFVHFHVKLK